MTDQFSYQQKILVAVQFGTTPKTFNDSSVIYSVFQRLNIAQVKKAFADNVNFFIRMISAKKFEHLLDQRMSYWEQKIPQGQQCFVHYARGSDDAINQLYRKCQDNQEDFVLLGIYHIEPQVSCYPYGFPLGEVPATWHLGERHPFTNEAIFWFNFFPEQANLFEITFQVWLHFNLIKVGVDCNQLTHLDNNNKLTVHGVDKFVQINLNRFTNLRGFFASAHEAGKHTFTDVGTYIWYGMLLKKI